MNYTGERPTLEHGMDGSKIRYKSVIPFCIGKKVLDYGCGIGHGSHYLSRYAKHVVGYDHSKECIDEAKEKFQNDNLQFSNSVLDSETDIITMIEVIEHIEKDELKKLFKDISNVKECALTTPNGDLFVYHPLSKSDRRGFHVWHYTERELIELFKKYFEFVEVYGNARDSKLPAETFTSYLVYMRNE